MSETPVAKAMNDIVKTIENPSQQILAEDLVLVYNLVKGIKESLNGKHPALVNIFNYLIGLK